MSSGFRDYRALVYAKGPYMFHVMRSTWGDEIFFDFLKKLARDLAGKEIVSRDIQRTAERALGGEMNWFFDQWLRGIGLRQDDKGLYLALRLRSVDRSLGDDAQEDLQREISQFDEQLAKLAELE